MELIPPPQLPQPLARVWRFRLQEVLRVGCQAAGFEKRQGSMHLVGCFLPAVLGLAYLWIRAKDQTSVKQTGTFQPTVQQELANPGCVLGSSRASRRSAATLLWEGGTCAGCPECPGQAPAPRPGSSASLSTDSVQGPCSCRQPGDQPRLVLTISTSVPALAGSTLCNIPPVSGTPGSQCWPGPGSQGLGVTRE